MMKQLFFVVGTQSNYRSMFLSAVQKGKYYGYNVQFIDLNPMNLYGKRFYNNWDQYGVEDRVFSVSQFEQLKDFRNKSIRKDAIILFVSPPGGFLAKSWKILQRKSKNIGMFTISTVPTAINSNRLHDGPQTLRAGLRWLKSLRKPVPAIWVISGSECVTNYRGYFRHIRSTNVIYGHSAEYENFHYPEPKHRLNADKDLKPYILLLDQGWFSKQIPEFVAASKYPPAPREKFAKEMCRFLHAVQLQTKLEVIVSCHPKADLLDTKTLYKGFKVVDKKSSDLIRHCKIAIANTSTSLQYAVIFNKPLVLFTTDDLKKSVVHPMEVATSAALNIPYLNISDDNCSNGLEEFMLADRTDSYANFMEHYVKQRVSLKLPIWDILFNELNKMPTLQCNP